MWLITDVGKQNYTNNQNRQDSFNKTLFELYPTKDLLEVLACSNTLSILLELTQQKLETCTVEPRRVHPTIDLNI